MFITSALRSLFLFLFLQITHASISPNYNPEWAQFRTTFLDIINNYQVKECSIAVFHSYNDKEYVGSVSVGHLIRDLIAERMGNVQTINLLDNDTSEDHDSLALVDQKTRSCDLYVVLSDVPVNVHWPKYTRQKTLNYFMFYSSKKSVLDATLERRDMDKYVFVIGVVENINNNTLSVINVCTYCSNGSRSYLPLYNVDTSVGLSQNETLFIDWSTNLQGKIVRIADNFANLKKEESAQKTIFAAIEGPMNCTFEFYIPSDCCRDGEKLPNGTWTGVIGEVLSGRADVTRGMIMTHEEGHVLDFVYPYDISTLAFAYKEPPIDYPWLTVFLPFSIPVWLFLASCFIASTVFLHRIMELKRKRFARSMSMFDIFWNYLIPGMFEDVVRSPKIDVVRCFLGFWFFFCVVMTITYKSKLTAIIAKPHESAAPESLEQLSESDFKWGTSELEEQVIVDLLSGSTFTPYQKLVKEILPSTNLPSECMYRALKEKFACITTLLLGQFTIDLYFIDRFGDQLLNIATKRAFMIGFTFGVRKGSPIRNVLDSKIQDAVGGGLIRLWTNLAKKQLRKDVLDGNITINVKGFNIHDALYASETDEESSFQVLTMHHFQGAFAALVIGVTSAFLLLGAEYIHMWRRKRLLKQLAW